MLPLFWRALAVAGWAVVVGGCASVSTREGEIRTKALIDDRLGADSGFEPAGGSAETDARVAELLSLPLARHAAVEVALLQNPHVRSELTRLGIAASDVVGAGRLENPVLSGSRTRGGGTEIAILSLTQSLSNLILLAPRRRLAAGEYARTQQSAAAAVIDLAADVEHAWYRYVGAEQVSQMRAVIAAAAAASGELAERFFAAGNISELELSLERRAAAQAAIAAARAAGDAAMQKYALNQLMGRKGEAKWTASPRLPVPRLPEETLDELLARAGAQRADVAAARHEIALLDDALQLAKRWRWLGAIDVGVERDREQDGDHLLGPTFTLALPIFDQGQAGIARAESRLANARARLAALEIGLDNDVRANYLRLQSAQVMFTQFAQFLNPAEAVLVERQQQRQHFMLIGQFELLLAKQQQYDTYQRYLETVRDFWLVRSDLARATGGVLSDADATPDATVGADTLEDSRTSRRGETP